MSSTDPITSWVPETASVHLERLIAGVVARTELDNLRATAVVMHILGEVSEVFEDMGYRIARLRTLIDIDKAVGVDLDAIGQGIMPEGVERRKKRKGTCKIVLTRVATVGAVPIPIGSLVAQTKANGTFYYETTAAGQWADGNAQSDAINVIAQQDGTEPDAIIGAIDQVISDLGIDSVSCTNTTACTGQDQEQDPAYRVRLRNHVRSLPRCTAAAIVAAVTDIDLGDGRTVNRARAVEDPEQIGRGTIYIDDGAGTAEEFQSNAGTETLVASAVGGERYLHTINRPWRTEPQVLKDAQPLTKGVDYTTVPAWGQIRLKTPLSAGEQVTVKNYDSYTGLVREAQRVVDGDPADRLNYAGFRAAGVIVTVLPATLKTIAVNGNLVVEEGYDNATVTAEVQTAIVEYINGLDIGEPVLVAQIIGAAIAVPGALNFTLTLPTADQYQLDTEVPRTSSTAVTIT